MKIKILSLLILFVFLANAAAEKEARESDPEPSMNTRFGIRAGTNFSSMSGYYSDVFGWQVGGAVDIPLKQIKMGHKYGLINLQPEVMLVSKGGVSGRILLINGYERDAYYIEVPVSCSFKFIVNQSFAVRVDLGPYLAAGLFGKTETALGKVSSFEDNVYQNGLKRLDFGRHDGVAIEFLKDFYFAMSQSVGFTNDSVESFYLTLGYNF
jgi:hypothetical protein